MEYQEFLQTEYDNFRLSLLFANEAYLENSEHKHYNKKTDTQFVFKKLGNDIFISFRGTESFKDILIDTSISKQVIAYDNNNSPIRVHKGFYQAYLSVRDKIKQLIVESDELGSKFFISGHSLGGALALLCALDIQYNYYLCTQEKVFLITLGQPRVGNEAFCNSTDRRLKSYFRFRNGNDIVPEYPKIGYEHCGKQIKLGEEKWYKIASFTDHKLANYLGRLIVT